MGIGRRATTLASPLCAAAALLAACGGDGDTPQGDGTQAGPTAPSTTAPAPTSPATAPSSSGAALDAPTRTDAQTADLSATDVHPAAITGITTARYATYDRVVLHVAGALPDYDVRWIPRGQSLQQPGSGRPVSLAGDRVLQVILHNTRDAHPADSSPNLPAIRQVRDFGAYEQVTTVALGVTTPDAAELGFRVRSTDADGAALVIDVAHAAA